MAAVKRALGNTASVRVDVNMAWSEVEATKGLAALEAAGCDLVEQPVESAVALGRLAARFDIPIMADEFLQGPETDGRSTPSRQRDSTARPRTPWPRPAPYRASWDGTNRPRA